MTLAAFAAKTGLPGRGLALAADWFNERRVPLTAEVYTSFTSSEVFVHASTVSGHFRWGAK